jgi:hypothetical protein
VRLVEAIPTAGALRFEMLSEGRSIGGRPKAAPRRNDKGRQQRYKGKAQRQARGSSRKKR